MSIFDELGGIAKDVKDMGKELSSTKDEAVLSINKIKNDVTKQVNGITHHAKDGEKDDSSKDSK